jgi:hypothetical protein
MEAAETLLARVVELEAEKDDMVRWNKVLRDESRELRIENTALGTLARQLGNALDEVLCLIETPPPNCSCHLSPPCSDCVDYGWSREVAAVGRRILADYFKARKEGLL